MFAVLVAVAAVSAGSAAAAGRATDDRETAAPVAVQRIGVLATGMRDEASMVLVGGALIGLAAAVRRAA
jgi:hypothetical protein